MEKELILFNTFYVVNYTNNKNQLNIFCHFLGSGKWMSFQLQLPHHQHQRPALGEGELRRAQPDQAAGRPAPEHSSPKRLIQFGKTIIF